MKELDTNLTERQKYAARIQQTMSRTVEAILDTGKILCEAKAKLKHGEWTLMIENDLPFTARTIQRLMAITHDPRLSNPTHVSLLPPSWGTLYQLSQLHDDEFERGIQEGLIRPDMKRSEVKRLHSVPGHVAAAAASGATVPTEQVTGVVAPDGISDADIQQAIDIIRETKRASTSALQRRLRIGYTRAARLMDVLEERGIIGPPRGSDPREILIDLEAETNERQYPSRNPAACFLKGEITLGSFVQCFESELPYPVDIDDIQQAFDTAKKAVVTAFREAIGE